MLSRFAISCQPFRAFSKSAIQSSRFGGSGSGGFGNRFTQQTSFNFRTKTGPTLKERLLGPTTGKPYLYGTYALIGASAFGIGALAYYGLGLSNSESIMQKSALWPGYVRDRLHMTYGYLAGGLGLTAASGFAASRSPAIMRFMASGGFMPFLASMAAIIGTSYIAQSIPYESTALKHAAWAAHCATIGVIFAPMAMLGGPALMRAAWYTAGLVGGLSMTAITAPSEKFLMMSGPLAMGFGVVFAANIASFFVPPQSALGAGMASIVVYGGLILFSMMLMYNTQRLVKKAEHHPEPSIYAPHIPKFDPINSQMSIYMDIINIFIRIAMLVAGGGQRRK